MLKVTVLDETQSALIIAKVSVTDSNGVTRTAAVDPGGQARFEGLTPGRYVVKATAESFRDTQQAVTVREGSNQVILRLALSTFQQAVVVVTSDVAAGAADGFTRTLSLAEINVLPGSPERLAAELSRLAGPGAVISVDGFEGARLPPKAQIQQIRFRTNSLSAEFHEATGTRVEVITRPGGGAFGGYANTGFSVASLGGRNVFAKERAAGGPESFSLNLWTPLAKDRTSLAIWTDGYLARNQRTIVATSPTGDVYGQVRQPSDGYSAGLSLSHSTGANSVLRAEYTHTSYSSRNLGVGDFDLPSRAYAVDSASDQFRVRNTRVLRPTVFSDLKVEVSHATGRTTPTSTLPTITVLDAFTLGGAGQSGSGESTHVSVDQSFDISLPSSHVLRIGFRADGGWWDSNYLSNDAGTYTFLSPTDYQAGRPSRYVVRVGDPHVTYSMVLAGWFVQDSFRPAPNLSLSLGVRQEMQSQVNDRVNIAPRASFSWNMTKSVVLRGGYGWFYRWYDAALYQQTLQVNGVRQVDMVINDPGFPVGDGRGSPLPPSIIRSADLTLPRTQHASLGLEYPITSWLALRADYGWARESNAFRSVNANAPRDGVRPNPAVGNVIEITPTGRRATDRLTVTGNVRVPRSEIVATMRYQVGNDRNVADSATSLPSNSHDPDADWGPSSQDVRHRAFLSLSAPLVLGLSASMTTQWSSALPYNITTGQDDNGDTTFNDRPAGIRRSSSRGISQWDTSMTLTKSISFGQSAGGEPRYSINLYANILNPFDHVNYNGFVGNLRSPFFGKATSAGAARRVEFGGSIGF